MPLPLLLHDLTEVLGRWRGFLQPHQQKAAKYDVPICDSLPIPGQESTNEYQDWFPQS